MGAIRLGPETERRCCEPAPEEADDAEAGPPGRSGYSDDGIGELHWVKGKLF